MIHMEPHIVIFDAYNYFHRCRTFNGNNLSNSVIFTFFRSLRSQIEKHKPTRVIFALEGQPKRQLAINKDYKMNRVIDRETVSDEKFNDIVEFHRQKLIIIDLLKLYFPVSCVCNADFEADDTIYNMVKNSSKAVPWTVVSTDTDFIQLLNEFNHVTLYNPVKKQNVAKPDYDYVCWKALRGDPSDNIPGVPGIGDITATKLVFDRELFHKKIASSSENFRIWEKNFEQIKFHDFSESELINVQSSEPKKDWDTLREIFANMHFNSIVNDKSWSKFVSTFDHLWSTPRQLDDNT